MIGNSTKEVADEAPKQKRKRGEKAACKIAVEPLEGNIRGQDGLLKTIAYPKKDNGLIDWRQLISREYIVLNRMSLAGKGLSLDDLSQEEIDKLIDESPEEDLIIKLAGFRQLAKIRGIFYEDSTITHWSSDHVVAKTVVKFLPNIEDPVEVVASGVASASAFNTDPIFAKFLETIATNRSFVRAIRNALGIASVGQDELKEDDIKVEAQNVKIQTVLAQGMEKAGLNIEQLKELVVSKSFLWNDKWVNVDKIDPAAAMSFIPLIKQIVDK